MPFSLPAGSGGAAAEYRVARSLRFNSADSAYLTRTFSASPVTRTKCGLSFWVKRAKLGVLQLVFAGYDGVAGVSNYFGFAVNDTLEYVNAGPASISTTAVFRDPSAWSHVVMSYDSTQATAANRVLIWVNGAAMATSGTAPALNALPQFALANANNAIGTVWNASAGYFADVYLAEFCFIDGLPVTPDLFGVAAPVTGVWGPKLYTGAYGTNGFKLDFADNSAVTATTLGKDTSGNGNNWTPNAFSVTAGYPNDSLTDTPTSYGTDSGAGGEVRGNYCTTNPLDCMASSLGTLSNGNLDVLAASATLWFTVRGTTWAAPGSGKWYWEALYGTGVGTAQGMIGIMGSSVVLANSTANMYPGSPADSVGYYNVTGNRWTNNAPAAYGAAYTQADLIGVALDMDALTVTFYKNGASQGAISIGSDSYAPAFGAYMGSTNSTWNVNFGQRPFSYAAPAGHKALCTQNITTPAVVKPSQYFDIELYSGDDVASRVMTGIFEFQGDFWWSKSRNLAQNNAIIDSTRSTAWLATNTTAVESGSGDQAFLPTGLRVSKLDLGAPYDMWNDTGNNYVAWVWKEGVVPGLDVVAFTSPASGNFTVAHSLGVKPAMVIHKGRGAVSSWAVWHQNFANQLTNYLALNATDAVASAANIWGAGMTSTHLGLNVPTGILASQTYIAYVFADVPGFSKFGSYTGNGSADGPFVWTGFRPRWLLVKRSDAAGNNWRVLDAARSPTNAVGLSVYSNVTDVEDTTVVNHDFLANGFKVRATGAGDNASGGTYIYAAFAETAFKYARGR